MRFSLQTVCVIISAVSLAAGAAYAQQKQSSVWQSVDDYRKLTTSADCQLTEKPSEAFLGQGALMVDGKNGYAVRSQIADVITKGGALLYVRKSSTCEHVFVLLGRASVLIGEHCANLRAGEEAAIADHPLDIRELMGEDLIGRRRLRMVKLDDNKSLSVSEFSIVQAVERQPQVYRLFHSTDPRDRAAKEHLLKTAAVLNFVTGSHGPYTAGWR